jgi:predicted O-methyltransferase YrrM
MARHELKNVVHQLRDSLRAALGTRRGAMFAELHRSLGLRVLGLEGFIRPEQARYLRELLVDNPWIGTILEIGFNAGNSSYVFLDARPDVRVVSFDLGEHGYIASAKKFIDKKFPGRHELVLGDSTVTVPKYRAEHPDARFELAFVDGGHEYEVVTADLRNCRGLVEPGALVVVDDLLDWESWGTGPVKAWAEVQDEGLVTQIELRQDGQRVTATRRSAATAVWALGRYN